MRQRPGAVIFALLLVAAPSSTASAFDGRREGLVLGIGMGVVPASRISGGSSESSVQETGSGLSIPVQVGYSWDERNMLGFVMTPMAHRSKAFDPHILESVAALAYTRYWGSQGAAPFMTLGVGKYVYKEDLSGRISLCWNCAEAPKADTPDKSGLALLAGGGYEFASHFQAGCYLSRGRVSSEYYSYPGPSVVRIDYTITRVDLVLMWLAY